MGLSQFRVLSRKPQTGWLINSWNFFLIVLGVGSLKLGCQHSLVLGKPACRMETVDFLYSHMAESRDRKKALHEAHQGINFIHEDFPLWPHLILIVYQRPHLLIQSGGGVSKYDFWVTQIFSAPQEEKLWKKNQVTSGVPQRHFEDPGKLKISRYTSDSVFYMTWVATLPSPRYFIMLSSICDKPSTLAFWISLQSSWWGIPPISSVWLARFVEDRELLLLSFSLRFVGQLDLVDTREIYLEGRVLPTKCISIQKILFSWID